MNPETTRQALALSRDWLEFASPFVGTLFLKALLWGLLFAGLGLLVALVAMGLIHKRRLLRRRTPSPPANRAGATARSGPPASAAMPCCTGRRNRCAAAKMPSRRCRRPCSPCIGA